MLLELSISNFAIIENLSVRFGHGLNIMTGETGSGKSIIFDALNIVLGSRSSRDLVKDSSENAYISATFYIESDELIEKIREYYGMDLSGERLLILTKDIRPNAPGISKLNGRTFSALELKRLTDYLVDIYGQHQHQLLLDSKNHLLMLDSLGDSDFFRLKSDIYSEYKEYKELLKCLDSYDKDEESLAREVEFLRFQCEEIDAAELIEGEDTVLEMEYLQLSNYQLISDTISNAIQIMEGDGYEFGGMCSMSRVLVSLMKESSQMDGNWLPLLERIQNVDYELDDIRREMSSIFSHMSLDEERLYYVSQRLDLINRLKMKYGRTLDEIQSYREKIGKELESLENYHEGKVQLEEKIQKFYTALYEKAEVLSERRHRIAESFSARMKSELSELNMVGADFDVVFQIGKLSSTGFDEPEFYIATNPSQPLKPLSKIVSGGEMSRIMLAFKTITAEENMNSTLVFDEIDAGISGITAQIVGEKIKKLSKFHQILLVSHLPQIACMADQHFVIEKKADASNVITSISALSGEERVPELARLLGGANITDLTIQHAREMLEYGNRM